MSASKRLIKAHSQKDLKKGQDDVIGSSPLSNSDFVIPRSTTKRNSSAKRKKRLSINNIPSEFLKDIANSSSPSGSKKEHRRGMSVCDVGTGPRSDKQKRFSPRAPAVSRKQSYESSQLHKQQNARPRLEKSTSAALPKFISEGPPSPMKISQKLKRSLTGSGGGNASKKDNTRSPSNSFCSRQPVNMELLENLLQLMGVDDDARDDIITFVENSLPDTNDLLVSDKLDAEKSKILDKFVGTANSLAEHQKKHKAATTIQSVFRTIRIRRRLRDTDVKQIVAFNLAVFSLYEMEKKYLSILSTLKEDYLKPIRARCGGAKAIMSLGDVPVVFSCLENILQLHQGNIEALEKELDRWPFLEDIGGIFLNLREGLQVYSLYVGNFNKAQDTAHRLVDEKNGRFLAFLQEKNCAFQNFLEMMSQPLYHLSKLAILVERLPPLCISGSKEEQRCNLAYSMLNEAAKFVYDQIQDSEDKLIVMKIQRRLTGYDKPLNMEQEDTKFLLETKFSCNGHKRVFLLFNDSLIIGKLSRNNQIKIKEKTELKVVFYEPVKNDPTSFVLKSPHGVHQISGEAKDVAEWLKCLEEHVPSRKRNPTYGRPMKEILSREKTKVPSVVTQCIECIEELGGIHTEGLFRISGERNDINALKDYLDNTTEEERKLSSYKIHTICGALKLWFRELPDPLLTFALYDKIIQLERDSPDDKVQRYIELLSKLGDNYPTLEYLMRFLRKVCDNSTENKMSASNAAIVFGPTLMRAQVETMGTTLNTPIVNSAVQFLIEEVETIFNKQEM